MKYLVSAEVTISMSVTVETDSVESARSIAEEMPMMELCHQCSDGESTTEWRTSGEFDGEPRIMTVELNEG